MSFSFNIDYSDPPHVMREKAELALKELRREKYNIILTFINSIVSTKIDSFLKFKNVNLDDIVKNTEKLKLAYESNANIFKIKFKITLSEEDLTAKTLAVILSQCVKSVGYKLIKTQRNSLMLYSIVNNE